MAQTDQRTVPMPEDFLSWRKENPGKELFPGMTEYQACGLSVYGSYYKPHHSRHKNVHGDIAKTTDNFTKPMAGFEPATARLRIECSTN